MEVLFYRYRFYDLDMLNCPYLKETLQRQT